MVIAQRVSTLTPCIRTSPTVAVVVVALAGRHIGYRTCQMNECHESHQNVSVLGIDGPMLMVNGLQICVDQIAVFGW